MATIILSFNKAKEILLQAATARFGRLGA